MAEYVVIGYCDKRVFCAHTKYEALEKARQFAQDLKFTSWLLYNRAGDLLFDSSVTSVFRTDNSFYAD